MKKNPIVCGLIAFWPFVLVVLVANIWGIYSWTVPDYINYSAQTWVITGRFISIITGVIFAIVGLSSGWAWCEGNYRKCMGLPRRTEKEVSEKEKC